MQSPEGRDRLTGLYGAREGEAERQARRYARLIGEHAELFGESEAVCLVSAPGRIEIGGNHTDHNRGCVLAAAINLDTVAAVAPTGDGTITVHSDGYRPILVETADLAPRPREQGATAALIRGVAARMREEGYRVGGLRAVVTSSVLPGSGLSSSAAFEVLVVAMLDALYGGWSVPGLLRAQIAQYAENVFFGKPCGLMDQTASSVGGLVRIDFAGEQPLVRGLRYDFAAKGYAVCVVNTGGSHGDLTGDYAAIRSEMEKVAAHYGKRALRETEEEWVEADLAALRAETGDRALLRALHFFAENRRVQAQADALERDDLPAFFAEVNASGDSSWMLLQNVWARPGEQSIALALALSKRILGGQGACRVHGGGFAGTILAFVPNALLGEYARRMEALLGAGACAVLDIRPEGAVSL
ncbi:MAG: galactokinase [Clostridia bacterium]|nr:galactokinase [Clostridia bacterium]